MIALRNSCMQLGFYRRRQKLNANWCHEQSLEASIAPLITGGPLSHTQAHVRASVRSSAASRVWNEEAWGIGRRTQSRAYLAPFLPSTVSQEQPPAVEPRWAQRRESHTASLCLRRLPARRRRRSRPANCALASARTVVPTERSCLARLLVDARDVERDVN